METFISILALLLSIISLALHYKKYKFEKHIRKSTIKPLFRYKGGGSGSDGINITFKNIGNKAYNVCCDAIDTSKVFFSSYQVDVLKSEEFYAVSATLKDNSYVISKVPFEFKLIYEDEDGNKYYQDVIAEGGGAKIGKQQSYN